MRYRLLGLGLAVVVAVSLTLTYAPYLPSAVIEGAPSLTVSPNSAYAEVAGREGPKMVMLAAPTHRPDGELVKIFATSQGAALVVMHDGKLALEEYGPGVGPDTRLNSYSMAKSLVAAMVFKAIAEGRLDGLDAVLGDLLPAAKGLASLSLERLLTMRAGIHFEVGRTSFGAAASLKDTDTLPNPFGALARLHYQGLSPLLPGLTMDETPPSSLTYQNINTALLGAVLEAAYQVPLEQLLSEKIWQPAGAATALWRRSSADAGVSAYCCLFATGRDWARIGTFIGSNGRPDAPFLPDGLWRQFLGLDVTSSDRASGHYGFHTFQDVLDRQGEPLNGPFTYFMGQGGQVLSLMPERGLVIYRAGSSHQLLHSTHYLVWNQIMDAE
jgi:CubicO group peptidase (beta-lactamase class C family)